MSIAVGSDDERETGSLTSSGSGENAVGGVKEASCEGGEFGTGSGSTEAITDTDPSDPADGSGCGGVWPVKPNTISVAPVAARTAPATAKEG